MGPAMAVANELMSIPDFGDGSEDVFAKHHAYIANFKKAVLMVAGSAVQKLAMQLEKEQEVLMNIADMCIQTYVAESTLLRTEKLAGLKTREAIQEQIEMMRVFTWDAAEIIHRSGKEALLSFAEGDELRMMMMGLRRFTKMDAFNIKESRRAIAAKLIRENTYCY